MLSANPRIPEAQKRSPPRLRRLDARRRSTPRTTPRQGLPKLDSRPTERAYLRELRKFIAELKVQVTQTLVPILVKTVQNQEDIRKGLESSAALPTRQDSPLSDLDLAADRVRETLAGAFSLPKRQEKAQQAFDRSQALHREQQTGMLRHSSIGISLFQETRDLAEQSRAFVRTNTKLIKSLEETSLDRIERVISEGIRFGKRASDVARDITDDHRTQAKRDFDALPPNADKRTVDLAAQIIREFEVVESRAEFIARDQIAKANADLSRTRQQANGVTKFIWRTLGDERVRPHHAALDGRTFTWESGANGLYPGQDPNCRCYAEAVL